MWRGILQLLLYQTYVLGMSLQTCFSMFAHIITFGYLKEEEESPFMTLRTLDSFCRSCSSSVTLNCSILLTVVTTYGLNQLGLGNNMWPFFVVPISRARKNPLTTIISSDTIRKLNLPYETISVKCIILERNKKKKQWSSYYFADKEKSLKFVLSLLLAFFGKFLA